MICYNYGSQQLAHNMEAPFSRTVGLRAKSLRLRSPSPSLLGPFRPGHTCMNYSQKIPSVGITIFYSIGIFRKISIPIKPRKSPQWRRSKTNHQKPLDPYSWSRQKPEVGTMPHFEPPSEHWTDKSFPSCGVNGRTYRSHLLHVMVVATLQSSRE